MAMNTRAADYGGATQGLYIPEFVTDIIISEVSRCSVLQHIVNQDYTIENLGLNCASKAHYTILTDISIGDFHGNNWNGEAWEPEDPFRSGVISLCNKVKITKKFSREEAIALCERWQKVQGGYEEAIGGAIAEMVERYGFSILMASANRKNSGNKAGTYGTLKLGDSLNPVVIDTKSQTSVTDLMFLLGQALDESGTCTGGKLKAVVPPSILTQLRREQSALGAGCCLDSNPAITGMTHPVLGMDVLSSKHMPIYRLPDGRIVQYILMVDPQHIAAPMALDYVEWQPIGHDINLIGNLRFDVAALSNKSIAVSAIVLQ